MHRTCMFLASFVYVFISVIVNSFVVDDDDDAAAAAAAAIGSFWWLHSECTGYLCV